MPRGPSSWANRRGCLGLGLRVCGRLPKRRACYIRLFLFVRSDAQLRAASPDLTRQTGAVSAVNSHGQHRAAIIGTSWDLTVPVMMPARRPAPSPFTRHVEAVCRFVATACTTSGPRCGLHSSQRCCKISAPPSCSFVLQFTLVDASLAPFFLRLPVLKHYRGFDLPPVRLITVELCKTLQWLTALRLPSTEADARCKEHLKA